MDDKLGRSNNIRSFILDSGIFNVSKIEKAGGIPKTSLQKLVKRQRDINVDHLVRIEEVLKNYGYLKDYDYVDKYMKIISEACTTYKEYLQSSKFKKI